MEIRDGGKGNQRVSRSSVGGVCVEEEKKGKKGTIRARARGLGGQELFWCDATADCHVRPPSLDRHDWMMSTLRFQGRYTLRKRQEFWPGAGTPQG